MAGFGGSVQAMINTLKLNRIMLRDRGLFKKMSDQGIIKIEKKLKRGNFSKDQINQAMNAYRIRKRKETIRVVIFMSIITLIVILLAILINKRVFF